LNSRSDGARPLSSVAILGTDSLLAALPATPVQLANACFASGYEAVFPASWGDELIASHCLTQLRTRGDASAVLCSCPHVAKRLSDVPGVRSSLVTLVPPPIAAARYIRAQHQALGGAQKLHITYVGACPGADDDSIDLRRTPAELLAELAEHGVYADAQPSEFGENRLADRRRFYSLPGGVPTREALAWDGQLRTLAEPDPIELLGALGEQLTARERVLYNVAPQLGCACSGAMLGSPRSEARAAVVALEPARADHEVLDHAIAVAVDAPFPNRTPVHASTSMMGRRVTPRFTTSAPGGSREGKVAPRRQTRGAWLRPGAYWARQALRGAAPRGATSRATAPRGAPARATAARTLVAPPPVDAVLSAPRSPLIPGEQGELPTRQRWWMVSTIVVASALVSALTSAMMVRQLQQPARESVSVAPTRAPDPSPPAVTPTLAMSDSADVPPSPPVHRAAPARAVPPKTRRNTSSGGTHYTLPNAAPEASAIIRPPGRRTPTVRDTSAPSLNTPTVFTPAPKPAPQESTVARPAPPAAPQPDIAAELRAIHEEIDRRKERIDSLARSLDSMKKPE